MGYRNARPYPGSGGTLRDSARAGQLLVYYCNQCRRRVAFLAVDLLVFGDPDDWYDQRIFPCGKCGRADFINITTQQPEDKDVGNLLVRRPFALKLVPAWKTVPLSGPYKLDDLAPEQVRTINDVWASRGYARRL